MPVPLLGLRPYGPGQLLVMAAGLRNLDEVHAAVADGADLGPGRRPGLA